ncbi:MAG: Gfo/Idh/MocA family protein [Cetobacterium sp.]
MLRIGVIGAGNRGKDVYANFILKNSDETEIVAVAEPNPIKRDQMIKAHGILPEYVFNSWEDFLEKDKFCDAIILATGDDMHFEPMELAMKKGYDILLEKPMSNRVEECIDIVKMAEKYGVKVMVCHVLRYTPFFSKLKELIDSGVIGEVVDIQHNENIGNFHFAHSFVRGNWRNSNETSPLILQKSCHDLDILSWLLNGNPCKKIASFGNLKYFRKENAPEGSADRCLECKYIDSCIYSPKKIYYNNIGAWPTLVASEIQTEEALTKSLEHNQYGRCVYKCDNNVVDNMVSIIEFENGVNVTFNLCAFTDEVCRTIKIMGTKGEIRGNDAKNHIEVYEFGKGEGRFANGKKTEIIPDVLEGGHGGGDTGLMNDFVNFCLGRQEDSRTNPRTSLESHIMAFAAEDSRVNGNVVYMNEYLNRFN